MKTLLTAKQRQILGVIIAGDVSTQHGQRVSVDMDRLLELLPYETSKQSMQFSLRALTKNGLVIRLPHETRRGRQRAIIEATDLARQIMGAEEVQSSRVETPISLGRLPIRIDEEVPVPKDFLSPEGSLSTEDLDDFLNS